MTAATTEAAAALAATSTTDLLTKAYALTHRIHEAEADLAKHRSTGKGPRAMVARAWARQNASDLRAARDLITAEVLRRTGDQS